jgi:hypothetical protein
MDHRNRIPVCPDEGSCLRKVISRYRFGHRLLSKFVMSWRSRKSKGRQLWTRSLAPSNRCAKSALITVLSTVFRNEKWRIVGTFFAGSGPRDAEGSTICGTNVRLRERQAGYLCLGDSYDLTLQAILSNGVATLRRVLLRTTDHRAPPTDAFSQETKLAKTTSMFRGQPYGWPLAALGTCEVIRFETNSAIRFLTADSPMPVKPLKTTSEAPRSEEG